MESLTLPYPAVVVVYALVALGGLLDCFFGFKLFRATLSFILGLTGAVAAGLVAWELSAGDWTTTLVAAVLGLALAALLAFQMLRALVGLGVGLLVAALTATLLPADPSWLPQVGPWVAGGLGAAIAVVLLKPSLQFLTAFSGAFRLVFGAWFLAGGQDAFGLGVEGTPIVEDPFAFSLAIAASLLVGLIGWGFQAWQTREKAES